MRPSLLAVCAVFLFVFAACAGEEEVGMSRGDSLANVSAEDILARMREASRSVESFHTASSSVSERQGERAEHGEEGIYVRGDTYHKVLTGEAFLGIIEKLNYRGSVYGRDSHGIWRPWDELAAQGSNRISVELKSVEVGGTPTEPLSNSYWYSLMLNDMSEVKRLEDELVDGRTFARISGIVSTPLDAPSMEAIMGMTFPAGAGAEGLPKELKDFFSTLPDQITAQHDLWIDPKDFLVYRSRIRSTLTRAGQTVGTSEMTAEYSEFNTSTLPGPLPEP